MTDDLRRASQHESALADAHRAITRAIVYAPEGSRRPLLAARNAIHTHLEFAARDLRTQANHAAASGGHTHNRKANT